MPLTPATRLGPYEIVAPLGAGGMGEVFRAKDTRLGREVAIKVLPDSLARDAERLARLEREARLLAALSHSGIASIYGIEDGGGTLALVMELVEGETLADRIARGALPADEALAVARQLAEALEYAHEQGIVHRDLKPANVKLRPDGTVKVLDFGLARALDLEAAGSSAQASQSPTLTQRMTHAGVLLGTAAYMAPEQARGHEVDRRADVWAFGAVAYEMLAGRRAFVGETISDTLASVMRDDPDWSALPPDLSPRWRRLIERCLAKNRRQRLQAIGEARIALEDLAAHPADGPAPAGSTAVAARPRRLAIIPWLVTAAALVALTVTVSRRLPPPAARELSIVLQGSDRIGQDIGYQPMAIAPDGRSVAYTVRVGGVLKLRIRRLDTREDVEVAGTDGARNLFFSRDGQWIGFFDTRKLQKVSVRGGTPVELAEALQDRLGTWLDDGTIVYSPNTTEPLYRIPETGGAPVAITTLDTTKQERTHRFPCALDGGPWVVFTAQTTASPGGYDDASIDAVSVRTGERRHLYKGARRAAWAPGGYLVLARGRDLFATPIDPRDPRITQDPVPVLAGVSGEASAGASYFSFADDGTLAWIPGGELEKTREVGWLDRSGSWTPTAVQPGPYLQVVLAPDGRRAVVQVGPGGGDSDLWLADLRSGAMNRLTTGGRSTSVAWLPDGKRIACSILDSAAVDKVVVRRLDGAGGEREIATAPNPMIVTDASPDGHDVIFSDYGLRGGRIHVAPVEGTEPARGLPVEGEGYEQAGKLSPDGRWLAYVTTKTRREEVCVRRLGGSGGSWQVSTNGGGGVRWGRDGGELFFVSGEILQSVTVTARDDQLTIGHPVPLFQVPASPWERSYGDYSYDPVGDRFLFHRAPNAESERREIALSLGWAARLRETVRGAK